jgi:hypothetical protein
MQKFHLQIDHGHFLLKAHYHIQMSFDAERSAQLRVLLPLPPSWSNALDADVFHSDQGSADQMPEFKVTEKGPLKSTVD